jgi:predicted type IV restriction endonuclease
VIDSIEAIRNGLRAGRFANEAAVSQGIVLRLLSELSWPAYDTSVVWPEYALRGRRVDFALCHPPGKPIVFVEVKQVGQSADAERQLFEYAFHEGVPMAILTTGQEWNFFLPAERGDYGERRVYKLDLLEREPTECVNRLRRYLDFGAITSGEAIEAARSDYRSIAKEREIRRTLPQAWQKLIAEGDELLIELISEKVENICGFRPDPDVVVEFLGGSRLIPTAAEPRPEVFKQSIQKSISVPSRPVPSTSTLPGKGFTLYQESYSARSARNVLVQVFQRLAQRDPTFLERFSARTSTSLSGPLERRAIPWQRASCE